MNTARIDQNIEEKLNDEMRLNVPEQIQEKKSKPKPKKRPITGS